MENSWFLHSPVAPDQADFRRGPAGCHLFQQESTFYQFPYKSHCIGDAINHIVLGTHVIIGRGLVSPICAEAVGRFVDLFIIKSSCFIIKSSLFCYTIIISSIKSSSFSSNNARDPARW